jgi:hypothetical protein
VQCPMCGGPLHLREPGRFVCEREHEMSSDELQRAAEHRVSYAFWMAIEALESEADALRAIALHSEQSPELADQAEKDARVLRELAVAHNRLSMGK